MDITPEYIKMCEKAEEIQKLSNCKVGYGDLMNLENAPEIQLSKYYKGRIVIDSRFNLFISYWGKGKSQGIWLPRQDQLQEMFGDIALAMMSSFYYFWKTDNSYPFKTLEQFWLAFVMKENNKIWDGENWIRKEEVKDHREKPDPKIKPWDEGE